MSKHAKLWLIPAALLVVAGIASLVAQIFILPGDVDASDWKAPSEYILEQIGPDDLINVQPNWTDDPYPYLTSVGDQIARQDKPLIEDTWDRERIWLLVESERIDKALEQMPFEASETKSFGDVSVVRIDVPKEPPVTYELLTHLDGAKVARVKGDKVERCTNWNERNEAWYCGRPDKWLYVGREFVDLGGDPHQCIWAHPPPKQKKLRIVFPDVPLQQTFRLRGGLNQRGARSKRATDVHLRVSVAGKWTEEKSIPARESSWKPIDFDTSELAGQTADVTVEVWAESIFDRFFCFNGWVLE